MARRRVIRGRCYWVREKNTVAGNRGTIIKRCRYVKRKRRKRGFWW